MKLSHAPVSFDVLEKLTFQLCIVHFLEYQSIPSYTSSYYIDKNEKRFFFRVYLYSKFCRGKNIRIWANIKTAHIFVKFDAE